MKNLICRLRLAWLILRANRFVVFVPTSSCKATVGESSRLSANDWGALAQYSQCMGEEARQLAEQKLLADIWKETARVQALEDEIQAILSTD